MYTPACSVSLRLGFLTSAIRLLLGSGQCRKCGLRIRGQSCDAFPLLGELPPFLLQFLGVSGSDDELAVLVRRQGNAAFNACTEVNEGL